MIEPAPPQPADEGIVQRLEQREERVHINLGPVCNNNCTFCMEEDRQLRYDVNSALTPDRVRGILEARSGAEEVCFTSGEPTMVEELPDYVALARDLGYAKRSVMTNGRRLAYMGYAVRLAKAGMNYFYISIHGDSAKLHDSLVRTNGAFEQTLKGLQNVARLSKFGVSLHTSTVITKRNVARMGAIYAFLRENGVHQVVFNVMQANGRANTHFELIFPTYTQIAAEFRRFLDACPEAEPEAYLVDIPLCTTTAIPDRNRGYVERLVNYLAAEVERDERAGAYRAGLERARLSDDGAFREFTRADLDAALREKRPECASCAFDGVCEGVWKNYVRRYGWDEFVPVT